MKPSAVEQHHPEVDVKSCNDELLRFLTADLRAAVWIKKVPKLNDQELITSFIVFHQYLMFISTGNKNKIFKDVSRDHLISIVRKWAELYNAAIDSLRKIYPRTPSSIDIQIGSTNWSKTLELSAEGISKIPHASRYAESWAERSIHCLIIFDTWYERLEFTKNESFIILNNLFDDDQLCVFDHRMNALPSFDLIKGLDVTNFSSIQHFYESKGWHVKRLEPFTSKIVLNIAEDYNSRN